MVSEVQNAAASDAEETTVTTVDGTAEEKIDVNELAAQLAEIKKAQAGSDRAYQEKAKELEATKAEIDKLRKASMDAEERAEFERQQKEKELEDRERVINNATLRLSLVEGLGAADMDTEWVDFVPGTEEKEVIENIGKLKELIDKEVGKRVNDTLTSTTKPKGGETPSGKAALDFQNLSLQEIEQLAKDGELKL